ncbi:hypothetical protein [Thermus tengchongensis]|uniref:Uncharacterized protein n=1 Tax=Thermus tengchongensis TaxID=1214928 RepID=A0A4Y9FAE2_9DEIN|nr:hypothetical protein [Thermus tengchongensis]TFU26154.1 hypothetical protein E0687_07115 [Thermus tengchongensis]
MAEKAPVVAPLELARWRWREVRRFLDQPESFDPDAALEVLEEFPLLRAHLRELYAQDPEAALRLAQEILAERERLLAAGFLVPETAEALLA